MAGQSLNDVLYSIPPVTRVLVIAYLGTSTMMALGVVGFGDLYWSLSLIVHKQQVALLYLRLSAPQIWRMLSSTLSIGPFSMGYLSVFIHFYQYSTKLELSPYSCRRGSPGRTSDYAFMISFFVVIQWLLGLVERESFFGFNIVYAISYVWSRKFPEYDVSFFGLFSFKGFYVPFMQMLIQLMLGYGIRSNVIGIITGHIFYMLFDYVPATYGKEILHVPDFMIRMIDGADPPMLFSQAGRRDEVRLFTAARWGSGQPLGGTPNAARWGNGQPLGTHPQGAAERPDTRPSHGGASSGGHQLGSQ